jgi:hypothetical protein
MKKDDFNLEVYKSLRDEINRRIEIHYRVILTKYLVVGGLFAYLVTHAPVITASVSPFLVSGGFAFVLDVIVLENLGWIRNAGSFVRNNIESTELAVVRWETRGAQPENIWTCFTVPGYLLGSWSIGVIFLVGALVVDPISPNGGEVFGLIATLYLLSYSLYLVFHHLGKQTKPAEVRPSPVVGSDSHSQG